MKNTYSIKMEIDSNGDDTTMKVYGVCPHCMSLSELNVFIDSLQVLADTCKDMYYERKNNGKIKSKKKQR